MATNSSKYTILNIPAKRAAVWLILIMIILSIPFLFEAPWTGSDYLFGGLILILCATMYEYLTRNMTKNLHKFYVALGVIVFIGAVMGWAATGP